MSHGALNFVAGLLSGEDKFSLFCALLPPNVVCFRPLKEPRRELSILEISHLYSSAAYTQQPLKVIIDGLGGEMLDRRKRLAKKELSPILRALYGMLEHVWGGYSSIAEAGRTLTHCDIVISGLESVVQLESDTVVEGSDEDAIFEEEDRRMDRFYVYRQACALAKRYRRALQKGVIFRKVVWARSLARSNMWRFLDAMSTILGGNDASKIADNFETFCDGLCVDALKEAYMEPHETLESIKASDMAGVGSGVMYAGHEQLPKLTAHQAGILCEGLTICISGRAFGVSVEFPPFSAMPLRNNVMAFRGFKELCVGRITTSPLVREFWKENQKDRPRVTVTKVNNTRKQCYYGDCCVSHIGNKIDIRSFCLVGKLIVPLCVVTIEPMAAMFEIKAGFLLFQGGQSALRAHLCRLPARELALL